MNPEKAKELAEEREEKLKEKKEQEKELLEKIQISAQPLSVISAAYHKPVDIKA